MEFFSKWVLPPILGISAWIVADFIGKPFRSYWTLRGEARLAVKKMLGRTYPLPPPDDMPASAIRTMMHINRANSFTAVAAILTSLADNFEKFNETEALASSLLRWTSYGPVETAAVLRLVAKDAESRPIEQSEHFTRLKALLLR